MLLPRDLRERHEDLQHDRPVRLHVLAEGPLLLRPLGRAVMRLEGPVQLQLVQPLVQLAVERHELGRRVAEAVELAQGGEPGGVALRLDEGRARLHHGEDVPESGLDGRGGPRLTGAQGQKSSHWGAEALEASREMKTGPLVEL